MTAAPFVRDEASTAMALRLITGINITTEDVEHWNDAQIGRAEDWAGAVHMQKTIPSIPVPPVPEFLETFLHGTAH